jgi:hypothetical protein
MVVGPQHGDLLPSRVRTPVYCPDQGVGGGSVVGPLVTSEK